MKKLVMCVSMFVVIATLCIPVSLLRWTGFRETELAYFVGAISVFSLIVFVVAAFSKKPGSKDAAKPQESAEKP